jgi:tRNA G18 (ribose-2'-O)-methylase SpoU
MTKTPNREIVVIAHNIRSLYNLGSIFRTSEILGVHTVLLSGYTADPNSNFPHIAEKIRRKIAKTSLGAEKNLEIVHKGGDLTRLLSSFIKKGWRVVGLEQDPRSVSLDDYSPPTKIALLLGEEVHGIEPRYRNLCHDLIEIPQRGKKESFNVASAFAIALYELTR